jgi:hypothetical protein
MTVFEPRDRRLTTHSGRWTTRRLIDGFQSAAVVHSFASHGRHRQSPFRPFANVIDSVIDGATRSSASAGHWHKDVFNTPLPLPVDDA